MNFSHLILLCLSVKTLNVSSQTGHLDSLYRLTIEVGKSVPWHIGDQNLNFVYNKTPMPSSGKISLISKKKYYGLSFSVFNYFNHSEDLAKEDVLGRYSIGGNLYFGKVFQNRISKINFIPQLNIGYREGKENIVYSNGNGWHIYNTSYYYYQSPSVGINLELNKMFLRNFIIGFETHYNFFMEKKRPQHSIDILPEHKVNKHVLSFVVKLGVAINWTRK